MKDNATDAMVPPAVPQRWSRWVFLVLIFLSGAIVGGVGGSVWSRQRMLAMLRQPDQIPDRVIPFIHAKLNLTMEQATQVAQIVRRRHAKLELLRSSIFPAQRDEFVGMREDVANVLTDAQRGIWMSLCQSIENRYLPPEPSRRLTDRLF